MGETGEGGESGGTRGSDGGRSDRSRIGWWLFVGGLALVAGWVVSSFVGLFALGVFGYYATRPITDRVARVVDSDALAAWLTVLLVLVPVAALAVYAGFRLFRGVRTLLGSEADPVGRIAQYLGLGSLPSSDRRALSDALRDPSAFVADPGQTARTVFETSATVLSALAGTVLLLALAVTLSYFLLANDDELAAGLRRLFGGRDTTAYAYTAAVDADLESVWFGNLLFVVVMFVVATATYAATNVVAPGGLAVPMVVVLGFLTGVASLIPLVVGKVVYVPVLGYLGLRAVRTGDGHLPFVVGVGVVYFLVLDILPQTFLQPYISGRDLNWIVLLFAYLLGPVLFGWYGFFLLPMLFIAMLEAVRIVLPELLHGERLTAAPSMADGVGSDPQEEGAPPPKSDGGTGSPSTDRAVGSDSSTRASDDEGSG